MIETTQAARADGWPDRIEGWIAAVDGTGAVYGIGDSSESAAADARRGAGEDGDYDFVPCTPAARDYVAQYGGAPNSNLIVSIRRVCLRSEIES